MSYTTKAYIKSLNKGNMHSTEMDDITILEEAVINGKKGYIVDYKGNKCYAIFNQFVSAYFVDDIYGRIEQ